MLEKRDGFKYSEAYIKALEKCQKGDLEGALNTLHLLSGNMQVSEIHDLESLLNFQTGQINSSTPPSNLEIIIKFFILYSSLFRIFINLNITIINIIFGIIGKKKFLEEKVS